MMANTYTQIHIQAVFAVKNRQCLVGKEWKDDLYKYMTGIIQHYDHKVLQINGVSDHVHIFFGMRPTQSLSGLMKQVKQDSSKWINTQSFLKQHFSWQSGFGAFSYAKSEVPRLIQYVKNQEHHHKKQTFMEEYFDLLEEFEVEYDKRYVFDPVI